MTLWNTLLWIYFRYRYHPLYITESSEGGLGQNPEKQANEKVFAGVQRNLDGYLQPIAAGRYCEWSRTTVDNADNYKTFKSFSETLELKCDKGEPAKLIWTVEMDTPNLVYYQVQIYEGRANILNDYTYEYINFLVVKNLIKIYSIFLRRFQNIIYFQLLLIQCYTHKHLGWKIHVVDPGQSQRINGVSPILPAFTTFVVSIIGVLLFSRWIIAFSFFNAEQVIEDKDDKTHTTDTETDRFKMITKATTMYTRLLNRRNTYKVVRKYLVHKIYL